MVGGESFTESQGKEAPAIGQAEHHCTGCCLGTLQYLLSDIPRFTVNGTQSFKVHVSSLVSTLKGLLSLGVSWYFAGFKGSLLGEGFGVVSRFPPIFLLLNAA